ncbi:hypothetical protein FOG48_02142 [Hanseniaspora uvarum]|nr:hypothetical protein FOG48_02142 [Hanseniaspora uvarum]
MRKNLNFLFAFLFVKTVNGVGEEFLENKIGCQINNDMELVSGLTGSVYYYPWKSYNTQSQSGVQNTNLYNSKEYLSGGYVGDGSIIAEDHTVYTKAGVVANDVTASELYFRNDDPCTPEGVCNGEVWLDLDHFTNSDGSAVSVPFKQFTFHMNGYIVPNVTGEYTLNLNYIDDLAIINIGANGFDSPNCCSNYSPTGDVSGNNKIQSIWAPNGPTGINEVSMILVAGVAYPIEFFFVNRGGAGAIEFEFTDPNGVVHRSFDGFIYHLSSKSVCNYVKKNVITIEWDQPVTSYTTSTSGTVLTRTNTYISDRPVTFSGTLINEDEIIYIPIPHVTTHWTGTSTTSFTSYYVTTGTNGSPTSSSIIVIETPLKTTTTHWTGTGTTTVTSDFVTTGTDGSPTSSTIIVIETPLKTTTTHWTGTGTTTVTSDFVTTGTDGSPTSSTIIVIETPLKTTTTHWTGTGTTTVTSDFVTTGTDGSPTSSTIIVIEIPSYSGWNTTTLPTSSNNQPSTFFTTVTGTKSETTVCTDYSCFGEIQESSSASSSESIQTTYLSSSTQSKETSTYISISSSSENASSSKHTGSASITSQDEFSSELISLTSLITTPTFKSSIEISPSASIITTDNFNKANSLKINALAILLLHFV